LETALVELVVSRPNDISAHWACSMVQKYKEEKRRVGEEGLANVTRKNMED